MSDPTPTTEEMREAHVRRDRSVLSREEYEAEFNRWLNKIKAEAWDEGHTAGQVNEHEHRPGRKMTNPYRTEDAP